MPDAIKVNRSYEDEPEYSELWGRSTGEKVKRIKAKNKKKSKAKRKQKPRQSNKSKSKK